MLIFKQQKALRAYLAYQKGTIAFVPTMGALHEGHLSLVKAAGALADICVCSIFVNPVQFNDPDDFKKYPKTIAADILALTHAGCDVLYLPDVSDIYPEGTKTLPHYNLGYLEQVLEGASRPGHFQGVCAVVDRLLQYVQPQYLLLGQKDYQQCLVIQQLLQQVPLHRNIRLHFYPTVRESDGLAMSSRNLRLTPAQRTNASALYRALLQIKAQLQPGSLETLAKAAGDYMENHGFKVDYISFADARNLALVSEWDGKTPLIVLAAAYMGDVRLIDNLLLHTPDTL